MTTFNDSENAFESKFAHDSEMQFRAEARRNKLLGLWAAGLLGKSGADADAYAVIKKAEADAQQTKMIAEAIADNGQPAVDFEILKRQVDAIAKMGSSENTKTIVLPTDVTKTLGGLAGLQDVLRRTDGA